MNILSIKKYSLDCEYKIFISNNIILRYILELFNKLDCCFHSDADTFISLDAKIFYLRKNSNGGHRVSYSRNEVKFYSDRDSAEPP